MVQNQCAITFVDRTIRIFNVLYLLCCFFPMAVGHSSFLRPD